MVLKEFKKNKEEDKNLKPKNYFHGYEVMILTILTCIVGIIMGFLVGYNTNNKKEEYSGDLREFIDNYNYISKNNVADVDDTTLIKGAIEGMLSTFDDDYSYVIDEQEQENFDIKLNGEYEGIGIEIVLATDDNVYIYSVFKDSPADKAGLKPGDKLVSVDGKNVTDMTTSDVATYIKENEKTTFNIVVNRDDKDLSFDITRDRVIINTVVSKTFDVDDKKIGYIYIEIFSNSAYGQFKSKLEELEKSNIDGLIVDVRYNNGGHLTTAHNIMSLFLNSSNVIYQTDKNGEVNKYYSTGKVTKTYPIVVLQNKYSASASEMLSAALKEAYGAKVVGENSYGKGTVQELITLSDGTEYKFTTKKWLTPKGNWINKTGVEVDEEVSLDETYLTEPNDDNDNQLQTALNMFR